MLRNFNRKCKVRTNVDPTVQSKSNANIELNKTATKIPTQLARTSMASLGLASLVLPSGDVLSAAPLAVPPPAPVAPSYGTLPSYNPPLFFEIVEDQVYRSNKCDASSFPFLATLQLNTVVYLSYDDLTRELVDFFKEKDINVVRRRLVVVLLVAYNLVGH